MTASHTDESYMRRCITLASLGTGTTAPNPLVGAVLVHDGRIIGEGYHRQYGQAHAEVNCLDSVAPGDRSLIPQATMYVSLEPCAHFGKTPPCADLIIREGIRNVVIGTRDPFPEVNGKGVEKLIQAGIEVKTGIMEPECRQLNRRFFTFHEKKRPYVVLKWAQSTNGMISGKGGKPLQISSELTRRLVHRWRREEAAILVGTRTALLDNPQLTDRFGDGRQPLRAVVDLNLELPPHLHLFSSDHPTVIFNTHKEGEEGKLIFKKVMGKGTLIPEILACLYEMKKLSLLVEGGAALLQSFIQYNYWDEARVITSDSLTIEGGTPAPRLKNFSRLPAEAWTGDRIDLYKHETCYS